MPFGTGKSDAHDRAESIMILPDTDVKMTQYDDVLRQPGAGPSSLRVSGSAFGGSVPTCREDIDGN